MEELWASGEAPVRSVMEALNGRASKPRAYTTYMTIMARLHKKGMLARRREGKTDYYSPTHEREEQLLDQYHAEDTARQQAPAPTTAEGRDEPRFTPTG